MSNLIDVAKQAQREMWAAGDGDTMSELIASACPKLLDRLGPISGLSLLDIGTGSGGSIAIPAARRGAEVTASDLAPEHFAAGRRRAARASVQLEWVEADAEALPFDDESFDLVVSTFGHMFAPRHAVAAAEMARVCRSGGRVGFTAWVPQGWTSEMFSILASRMPEPPSFAQHPSLWGSADHIAEMFEPTGLEFATDVERCPISADSVAAIVEFYERNFGPFTVAKSALGELWQQVRLELESCFERWNAATDGTLRIEPEYVVAIARKPA